MAQTLDLPGLGPYGNRQREDWERQGLRAWCRRRICQGSDRRRTRTPRTRIEEDEEWGYGLTVPRSERSTIHGESETLGRPHQVRLEVHARARCSRRALLPFETPFEPAFEPPIATSSESSSEWVALRSRALSRVGIPPVQRLRGVHLDAGRGRRLWRHRRRGLRFRGLAGGVLGRLAVALRHQLPDLRPRLTDPRRHLGRTCLAGLSAHSSV